MFYHEQDTAVHRPGGLTIAALMLLDPTLKPTVAKPLEEDMQDAKTLYYYSTQQATVHTKRYQIGLAEGLLLVFGGFTDTEAANLEVDLEITSFAVKTVEENLLMAVVIDKHPDTLDDVRDPGLDLISRLYEHWRLFYGSIKAWRDPQDGRLGDNFRVVMDHFIAQFIKFSATNEDESLISPLRLYPIALERLGMQKTHFLITNQIENVLKVDLT